MVFKIHWERTEQRIAIPDHTIREMVHLYDPTQILQSHEVISGGCANLNIKCQFENRDEPFILRIYLQDKTSVFREQKLGVLLSGKIPIPQVYYIGEYQAYTFGIVQFLQGTPLREVLMRESLEVMEELMQEVGQTLGEIHQFTFPKPGFFDNDLHIIDPTKEEGFYAFTKACLQDDICIETLGKELIWQLEGIIDRFKDLYPDPKERNLVHADFDPSNILVNQNKGKWEISGILDWEFAFSGSTLCDIANMLRYAHEMPPIYEEAFLFGLQRHYTLPHQWQKTIDLLNVLSLLDCLSLRHPLETPKQCADLVRLIQHIASQF